MVVVTDRVTVISLRYFIQNGVNYVVLTTLLSKEVDQLQLHINRQRLWLAALEHFIHILTPKTNMLSCREKGKTQIPIDALEIKIKKDVTLARGIL
ncbi:hypothetical protein FKM82_022492 [Ascaphus truei]